MINRSSSTDIPTSEHTDSSNVAANQAKIATLRAIFKYKKMHTNISHNLDRINNSILRIKAIEKPTSPDITDIELFNDEINAYLDLNLSLDNVFHKINSMLSEKDMLSTRSMKILAMLTVLEIITETSADFFDQSRNERMANVILLNNTIQKELSHHKHSIFIDEHNHTFWEWGNAVCGAGFFSTDSRMKLSSISQACNNIINILIEESQRPGLMR